MSGRDYSVTLYGENVVKGAEHTHQQSK